MTSVTHCRTGKTADEESSSTFFLKFGAMHFIYYINRSIATKVDSTYLGY